MTRPNTVKISGINYTFKEKPNLKYKDVWPDIEEDRKERSLLGAFDIQKQLIHINKEQSFDTYKITLLHEIIHGMLSHTTFAFDIDAQENICSALETMFYNFIRDNPKLIAYIQEKR